MNRLLDTVTVSELRRLDRADPSVLEWSQKVKASIHWISVVTVMEIQAGIHNVRPKDPDFAALLSGWLESQVIPSFIGRMLNVNLAIAKQAAEYRACYGLSQNDSLIGATAKVHGLALVTRNIKDFENTGISLENPWDF